MCHPVSWIEKNGGMLYVRGEDLATERGRECMRLTADPYDYCGHGFARLYFGTENPDGSITPLEGGVDKEVTDFSSPANFPAQIAEDLKRGRFCGVFAPPTEILLPRLDAEYQSKWDALYAEYQPKRDALYAEYRSKRAALYAEYWSKRAALYAEYRSKRAALAAEYQPKRDALDAEYWGLITDPKNQAEAWK